MIHIHVAAMWHTVDYAYYMVQNAIDMSTLPSNLKFTVYCQDQRAYEFVKSSEQFKECAAGAVPVLQDGQGSSQHAVAIHEMLRHFSPDCHNAIFDGDTVILSPDWDKRVEQSLKKNHLMGVCYDYKMCVPEAQYYRHNPTATWLVVRQGLDAFTHLDMSPQKSEFTVNEEASELYHVPVGHNLIRDTGWCIPGFVKANGLKALGLEASPSQIFRHYTYYTEYAWEGQPFVAHMQRSSSLPFRMTARSREFYDSCERYLDRTVGHAQDL